MGETRSEITWNNKSNGANATTPGGLIAVAGTEQQKAITSPGHSTKKKKSTQTVVTTPPLGWASPETSNSSLPHPSATTSSSSGPLVTRQQLHRLRSAMAKHHQLLLQQATLAVRAAYVQKLAKDNQRFTHGAPTSKNAVGGAGLGPSSLPASMLNTRSLTFCAPQGMRRECSYDNDFYHGENAEELAECLDGAVGMLQDLEQVRYLHRLFDRNACNDSSVEVECHFYFYVLFAFCRIGKMPFETPYNFHFRKVQIPLPCFNHNKEEGGIFYRQWETRRMTHPKQTRNALTT
jgi:hypothetical protein